MMRASDLADPRVRARASAIAILVALAAAALGAGLLASANTAPPLDPMMCRQDRPLAASTVILVDVTDALTARQAKDFDEVVRAEQAALPRFGKLTLVAIDGAAPYELKEQFSRCRPKSVAESNPWFDTASRVRRRWDTQFGQPADGVIQTLARGPGSTASPLLQAVTAVTWRRDFGPEVAQRKLVIVSDLIQHDPAGFTLLRPDALKRFAQSEVARGARPDLKGVEIRISVLHRPHLVVLQDRPPCRFGATGWLRAAHGR